MYGPRTSGYVSIDTAHAKAQADRSNRLGSYVLGLALAAIVIGVLLALAVGYWGGDATSEQTESPPAVTQTNGT